jgi:hypothetical protein
MSTKNISIDSDKKLNPSLTEFWAKPVIKL